jgi:hypothetical protein
MFVYIQVEPSVDVADRIRRLEGGGDRGVQQPQENSKTPVSVTQTQDLPHHPPATEKEDVVKQEANQDTTDNSQPMEPTESSEFQASRKLLALGFLFGLAFCFCFLRSYFV